MLELHDVHVRHPGRWALRGVDLTVAAGEFVVVVGANGSGKSTLLGAVSGSVRLARGKVSIGDRDVSKVGEHRRAERVGHVIDDPRAGTAGPLDIAENLAFAMCRGRRRACRRSIGADRRAAAGEALAQLGLGLEHRLDDPVALLSAGQRQALAMVMAGLTSPDVLLLDEHLAALDPRTARKVRDLTVELVARLGCATLMVSHNMRDAVEIGDRLVVLRDGRIAADVSGSAKNALAADDIADLVTPANGRGQGTAQASLVRRQDP